VPCYTLNSQPSVWELAALGGTQAAGPVPRVALAVWLESEEVTQLKEMPSPGWALESTEVRSAGELMVSPLAEVMTSPATSPADWAALLGTTSITRAPDETGDV
jgi:hypothetical protein